MPRKPVPIDLAELEKLAAMQCTEAEVAAWFSKPGATLTQQAVSKKLHQEPYKTTWESGKVKGKISLRRKQMQRAEAGDKTMLVWLGKQWLGQRDRAEVGIGGTASGEPIRHEHDFSGLSDEQLEQAIIAAATSLTSRTQEAGQALGATPADDETAGVS